MRIKDFIKKYLIPCSHHIELISIKEESYSGVEIPDDTFSWIGGGDFCQKTMWVPDDPSCEIKRSYWIGEEETALCEQENVTWEGIDEYCL